jgi:hypothetical protein
VLGRPVAPGLGLGQRELDQQPAAIGLAREHGQRRAQVPGGGGRRAALASHRRRATE